MPDYMRGEIVILKEHFKGQVKKQILEETNCREGTDIDNGHTISVSNIQAVNGKFEELEFYLADLGIPFDRYSEGFFLIQPEERHFRPELPGKPEIDIEIITDNEHQAYLHTDILRPLLGLKPDILKERLKELLDEADPQIPPLRDYEGLIKID